MIDFMRMDGAGTRLMGVFLSFLHTFPVDKAVGIVDEEGQKAKYHRKIGNAFHGSEYPKPDKHDVVEGVADCVVGTAQNQEHRRKKACGNGKGTQGQVCGVKVLQNEIERRRHRTCGKGKERPLFCGHRGDFHFRFPCFRGVAKPTHARDDCARQGHKDVGNHFPIVTEVPRDNSI